MFGGVREVPRRSRPGLLRFAHNDKLCGPMAETVLNLRGLRCPLPALKTRKVLKGLAPGDRLVVECTDPLSTIDIPNLLRETGDVLEGDAREQDVFVFRIRKSE
jgi:tRNA 2-thiouridine synthesizing protein A